MVRYCESCWVEYYGEPPQNSNHALIPVEAVERRMRGDWEHLSGKVDASLGFYIGGLSFW